VCDAFKDTHKNDFVTVTNICDTANCYTDFNRICWNNKHYFIADYFLVTITIFLVTVTKQKFTSEY